MNKGLMVAFGGCDGSGKTTMAKLIRDHYKTIGIDAIYVNTTASTDIAKKARELIMETKDMSAEVETLIYCAAIQDCIDRIIKPALDAGKLVVCDRFTMCTYAYQYYTRGSDIYPRMYIHGYKPFNFILDIDPEVAMDRVKSRTNNSNDKFDNETLEFYSKVRKGYLEYAGDNDNCMVIDANRGIEEIMNDIIVKIGELMKEN